MSRLYTSFSEVVNEYVVDKTYPNRFYRKINDKRVAKTFITIRNPTGKTQDQMAETLGCTQGTIPKFENSGIDAIKLSDLVPHDQPCGPNLTIGLDEEQRAVQTMLHSRQRQIRRLKDDGHIRRVVSPKSSHQEVLE